LYIAAVYITMDIDEILAGLTGFEWDEGNLSKNWEKHQVSALECEQVFFNRPLIALPDERHSESEPRFYALGQTDTGRRLFIVFTARSDLIRMISARDISRKERKIYEGL